MGKRIIILLISTVTIIILYYTIDKAMDGVEYRITSVRIYKDTPAWKLALAVKRQNSNTIKKIAKQNPELLNYQEPKYGATLLLWAIGMEKYKSAKTLLECGADPDIAQTANGETPLFLASGFSWIDNDAKKDPKYVKLLLSYGADPNINSIAGDGDVIEYGTSPLVHSIGSGIEKTKALVEAGADINHKLKSEKTVAVKALLDHRYPEYAHYLIVDKKANITEPYYRTRNYGTEDPNEEFYPVNLLRSWVFDLNSEKHKIKMEIVQEFERQGVNYWKTTIPSRRLNQIKMLYPDTWEEYIKKY